jgi:solute carrier family 10 (sodium/bile acid cotransporter), member 7
MSKTDDATATKTEAAVEDRISTNDNHAVAAGDEENAMSSTSDQESVEVKRTCKRRLIDFYWEKEFLILVIIVISLAKAYPELGAVYLDPDITASWLAVSIIFFMGGLCLKTEELGKAVVNMPFNLYVLMFNFGVVSSYVFGVSRGLKKAGILSEALSNGLAICGSLPISVNMALVFTKVAGGDEAAAVFITAASNMSGVFLSPLLILGYLGVSKHTDLVKVFWQLALRVIVPVIVGQFVQLIDVVHVWVKHNPRFFKQAQQYCLIYVIYCTFCKTFKKNYNNSHGDVLLMVLFELLLIVSIKVMAWYSLKFLFPNKPKLRVMGLFGCVHKTIAIGVPLISVLYKGDPNVGLYTLPILIWHPMQLIVGTCIMPRLQAFVKSEKERLGIVDEDDEDDNVVPPEETAEAMSEGRSLDGRSSVGKDS